MYIWLLNRRICKGSDFMKKKIMMIIFSCVLAFSVAFILIGSRTYAVIGNSSYNQLGIIFKRFYQEDNSSNRGQISVLDIYAYGNNATVLKKDIQQAEEFYVASGLSENEAEKKAVNYMLEREALYAAAISAGYSVTEKEVREYVAALRKLLEKSSHYDSVEAVMDAFDSEEEYWEFQVTVYQKNLPIEKYVNALEVEFRDSLTDDSVNTITNELANDYMTKWNEFYSSHKQNLVKQENYQIETNVLKDK